MRNVRSVRSRDVDEMNGLKLAASDVKSGAQNVENRLLSNEDFYKLMGKLSDSFSIMRSNVFFVSASRFFSFLSNEIFVSDKSQNSLVNWLDYMH